MARKNPTLEASTGWRTYAAELAFDARKIQARLGRPLSADELEELEELDDAALLKATDGEPTFDAFQVMTEYGYPLDRPAQKKR